MSKRILLVEDDESLGFVIKDNLVLRGYAVDLFETGSTAWQEYQTCDYDICLLDIMLPHMDGLSLAKNIRGVNRAIPIIFLTARSMQEDKLAGFEIGVDDYITKPFSMEELIYRIEVFLKRSMIISQSSGDIHLGNYRFDSVEFKLYYQDQMTKLTRRESEILYYLYQRINVVCKREELLLALWGDDDYFKGRSLDVFISKLRKYLSHDPCLDIENIHGVGFKLSLKH
ncbi:response regulator transcription factor [Reichenbachiella agarivorans]|uniref:Response regulator transcription factor n=1 Tax=Reichenbachiella agarivorans TaxID=2979464 RepID=A0ABY6CT88_9BACT|nr:response regulator transcription factor [Reichenbachiella agarivorans]UXP33074.1 response regulator transcription factor [Reichenbachiella agarivorans]